MREVACLGLAALLICGCGGPGGKAAGTHTAVLSRATSPGSGTSPPANQPLPFLGSSAWLRLQVFQLVVPTGSISRSSDFWKHIDEQRIDPATYDVLLKNGVRVGIAPNDDWPYFREILDQHHAIGTTGVATGNGSGHVELTMKKEINWQDIFYVDDFGDLHGRTYEKCENLLSVSFWPELRHPEEVRISASPTVRSLRSYLEYTVLNGEHVIQDVRPETLFDLNLRAIIPANCFLVIAPSRDRAWPTSLGDTFFRINGAAEQYEQVLVLVPRLGQRLRALPQ